MRRNVAAVAAVVVLGAAGCGGNSSTLTSAQLVTRADALCKQYVARGIAADRAILAQAQRDPNVKANTRRWVTQLASEQAATGRQEYAALGALKPPSALADAFTRFVTIRRQGIALAPSVEERISGQNPNKPQTDRIGHEAAALAHKIGFKVCL